MSFLDEITSFKKIDQPVRDSYEGIEEKSEKVALVSQRALSPSLWVEKDKILEVKATQLSLRERYKVEILEYKALAEENIRLKLKLGIKDPEETLLDPKIQKDVQEKDPTQENDWFFSEDEMYLKNKLSELELENTRINCELKIMKLEVKYFKHINKEYTLSLFETKSVGSDLSSTEVDLFNPEETAGNSIETKSYSKRSVSDVELQEKDPIEKKKEEKRVIWRPDFVKTPSVKYELSDYIFEEEVKVAPSGLSRELDIVLADNKENLKKIRVSLKKDVIMAELFKALTYPFKESSIKHQRLKSFIEKHSVNVLRGGSPHSGKTDAVVSSDKFQEKSPLLVVSSVIALALRFLRS